MTVIPENPNMAVFTVRQIMNENKPILYVTHDEDSFWQFLTGEVVLESDAMVVVLGEILEHDPSIVDILNLELGFSATREFVGGNWTINKTELE